MTHTWSACQGKAAANQAKGSMEGRGEWQQELGVPCSWFICLITIVITTQEALGDQEGKPSASF